MDKDTEKWYAGLMHGKDLSVIVDESTGGPNGKKKRAKRRTWTEKEDQIIMDHCALYRHPTETDMHEVIADLNASLQSICSRYRVLRRKLPKNVLPLTAEEHQAIADAVEERRPRMVRYMDVRDKIKRPFAETLYLTLPLRTQKQNLE
ncbi:hypothetical protein GGF37_004626 [Kickxella alabastrina]|nr:hypothetical protein GGF37_004626 [Kickxella alabastrina]